MGRTEIEWSRRKHDNS